jgi:hypothetical protein
LCAEATAVVVDGAISFTHRVSHFLAVVGSGTSPAVSEFRAWYGATRAIVGPNDAREVVASGPGDIFGIYAHGHETYQAR